MCSRGLKRELTIELESSGLTSETGEFTRYRAINRWDERDEFGEWAQLDIAVALKAECIVGVTNEQLCGCRPTKSVLEEFFVFFFLR
jgi:hypothetical protein